MEKLEARRSANFKQSDVTRAAKGALAAGLPVGKIEIDRDGKIAILTSKPEDEPPTNDWD